MGWQEDLNRALEGAVMDALDGGAASPEAVAAAERNMRAVLDRWLATGRLPDVKAYHLRVEGGAGLSVDLDFEYVQRPTEININIDRRK